MDKKIQYKYTYARFVFSNMYCNIISVIKTLRLVKSIFPKLN